MGEDVAIIEAETDAAVPRTRLTIDGGLPGGYALRHPVSVVVWEEGEEVVADAPALDLHAFGGDVDAALMSLRVRIVDHLKRLEEREDRLAPRLRDQRRRLRALLIAPGA